MRRIVVFTFAAVRLVASVSLVDPTPVLAQQQTEASVPASEEPLRQFLRDHFKRFPPELKFWYVPAFVDLNGDGQQEVILYLTGQPGACASAGCTTMVLERQDDSYRFVSWHPGMMLPIQVYEHKPNGWNDIGFRVRGQSYASGPGPPYDVVLCFDGESYPLNEDVPPSHPAGPHDVGEIVIDSSDEGRPIER